MSLEWQKRFRKHETPYVTARKLFTCCKRYYVAECINHYGLPKRWLAVRRLENGNEIVISRHRKKAPAIKSVEKYDRLASVKSLAQKRRRSRR